LSILIFCAAKIRVGARQTKQFAKFAPLFGQNDTPTAAIAKTGAGYLRIL
jgi:hypothetical protein